MKPDLRMPLSLASPSCRSAVVLAALAGVASADIRVPADEPTVQAAIDAAALTGGDTIILAPGVYRESLVVPAGPLAIEIRSETPGDDGVVAQTILSGDLDGDGEGDARILRIDGPDSGASLALRGLTFADGVVVNSELGENPETQPIGGAVRMDAGTLAIESCVFLRNRVDGAEESRGGAVAFADGTLTIDASRFEGNERNADDEPATYGGYPNFSGGCLHAADAVVQIVGTSFVDNRANFAAAVHVSAGSDLTMRDCDVVGNQMYSDAAVYANESSMTALGTRFKRNRVEGFCAALKSRNGPSLAVHDSTFIGNHNATGGQGIFWAFGADDISVSGLDFRANTSIGEPLNGKSVFGLRGGTIRANAIRAVGNAGFADVRFTAETSPSFAHNVVLVGLGCSGTILDQTGVGPFGEFFPIVNSTLVDITPTNDGGLSVFAGFVSCVSDVDLIRINRGGLAQSYAEFSLYPDTDSNPGPDPIGNIDAMPQFLRAPDDGGDGWGDDPNTPDIDESANDDFGDLRLVPGSPAIDAGDTGAIPADVFDLDDDGDTSEPVPFDIAGVHRRLDDPNTPDAGVGPAPVVDMGAYEFNGACSIADLAEPFGVYGLNDIGAFVNGFLSDDPAVDFAPPIGVLDLSDIVAFVEAYLAGCP